MHLEGEQIYLIAASLCAILAARFDLKYRKIPNKLTAPALLAGLILHLALDGWQGLLSALGGAAICGVIFLIFHVAGGMGAGDVKLIAATGCLVGLPNTAYLLVLTSLAGGVMAIGTALLRGQLRQTLVNTFVVSAHHARHGLTEHPELNVRNAAMLRLPYGLAIAVGSTLTLYLHGITR